MDMATAAVGAVQDRTQKKKVMLCRASCVNIHLNSNSISSSNNCVLVFQPQPQQQQTEEGPKSRKGGLNKRPLPGTSAEKEKDGATTTTIGRKLRSQSAHRNTSAEKKSCPCCGWVL